MRATSQNDTESTRSEGGVFASARRVGEILHAVASALREIPFADIHGIEIRRIGLTVEKDAFLDAPIEVRARAAGNYELTPGRQLVVIHCQLTNQFGDRVAVFSVETEAKTELPDDSERVDGPTDSVATTDAELELVDNIPV